MSTGKLISIHTTSAAGQPMISLERAHAIPGLGLEGDRYAAGQGKYPNTPGSGRQITLIEIEAIQALKTENNLALPADQARRNLITQGVPLNHLVGKDFRVGEVVLRGVRLCEPCDYLAQLTYPQVLPGLIHRGGLRADILTAGTIRPGDAIEW